MNGPLRQTSNNFSKKKSFTLIELLIVVAIIGILAGVGVPMYNNYIQNAKIAMVKSNFDEFVKFMQVQMVNCETSNTIQLNSNENSIVKVYNSLGILVDAYKLDKGQQQINTQTLLNGVYILSIQSKSGTENMKLLKN